MKSRLNSINEKENEFLTEKQGFERELADKLFEIQSKYGIEYEPNLSLMESSVVFTFKNMLKGEIIIENNFLEDLVKMMDTKNYRIITENPKEIKFVFDY